MEQKKLLAHRQVIAGAAVTMVSAPIANRIEPT
jgi:hypothetical protein